MTQSRFSVSARDVVFYPKEYWVLPELKSGEPFDKLHKLGMPANARTVISGLAGENDVKSTLAEKSSAFDASKHPRGHGGEFAVKGSAALQKLPPDKRVWQNKTEWGSRAMSKNSRLLLGSKGEFVAANVLEEVLGAEFKNMNAHIGGHSPIDLLGDTSAVEVKAGKTTNGRSAQHWRITHGEPGEAEKAKMAKMTPDQLHEYNEQKTKHLVQLKLRSTAKLSQQVGRKLQPKTVGVIFSPRMDRADVFIIPGFHARLGWSEYATDKYYAGTLNVNADRGRPQDIREAVSGGRSEDAGSDYSEPNW